MRSHNLLPEVIPGHRNAVNPEPNMNTAFAKHAETTESALPKSVCLGSRFRGKDLRGE
jgi:hypothetical protein